ncbi:hypothetical protein ACEWY4_010200 [Coilia grayii]|uniref:Ig-like domain-containing protein n=1 Tax=Coilia grayii TaxID=363190 RepID=A0ABD1K8Q8_9TELE
MKCFGCGQNGHLVRACPEKREEPATGGNGVDSGPQEQGEEKSPDTNDPTDDEGNAEGGLAEGEGAVPLPEPCSPLSAPTGLAGEENAQSESQTSNPEIPPLSLADDEDKTDDNDAGDEGSQMEAEEVNPILKVPRTRHKRRRTEPLDGEEYLDISGITRTQAGRYECKASNDVASPDVKYINVIVNYAPFIKDTKSSDPQLGRMGVLQCEASAVPKPEFKWYRDDKRLSNGQGISIQMMGSRTLLLVSNVTDEDYGNYTCVATNRLGIHNASVFLYRPGTANNMSGAAVVSQSLWLLLGSLTCLLLKC